ncbi:MAG: TerB family tellurite resistance protein [Acidobacteriota bacterium]|nr:MAG: TerB family tellurite resistance protein [Acidobacteriota bacterium]
MIRTIRDFFDARIVTKEATPVSLENAQRLATAALLIEISRADFEVADEEKIAIEQALRDSFGISDEETREIIALAEQQVKESISLYEFTRLVDESFTPEQKKHIVGLLWQVAFSDERLEEREEYLIRKTAKLLHVPHADFIDEKLKVKKARG